MGKSPSITFADRSKGIDTIVDALIQDNDAVLRIAAGEAIKAVIDSKNIYCTLCGVTAVTKILRSAGEELKGSVEMRSLVNLARKALDDHQAVIGEHQRRLSKLSR